MKYKQNRYVKTTSNCYDYPLLIQNFKHLDSIYHHSIKYFPIQRLFTARLAGSISWFHFLTDKILKWLNTCLKALTPTV